MGRGDHLRPDLLGIKKNYQTMATNSSRVINLIHVVLLSYFKRIAHVSGLEAHASFFLCIVRYASVCVLQAKVETAYSSHIREIKKSWMLDSMPWFPDSSY